MQETLEHLVIEHSDAIAALSSRARFSKKEWRVLPSVSMMVDTHENAYWNLSIYVLPGEKTYGGVFMHQWSYAKHIGDARFMFLSDVCMWRQFLVNHARGLSEVESGPESDIMFVEPISVMQSNREYVFSRDRNTCRYCGASVTNGSGGTIDHVFPKILFGYKVLVDCWHFESPSNLVVACKRCNCSKKAKPAAYMLQRLGVQQGGWPSDVAKGGDDVRSVSERRWGHVILNPVFIGMRDIVMNDKCVMRMRHSA